MYLTPRSPTLSLVVWFSVLLCDAAVGEKVDKTKNEYKDGKKDFTQSDREAMLVAHNKLRSDFAKKHNAANMRLMEYDCGLEDFAFRYLLSVKCQMKHSSFEDRTNKAKTGFGGYVGENLWHGWWGGPPKGGINWTKVAESWYSEIKWWRYAPDGIGKDCEKGKPCGHFTQMIWHDAQKLGCAGCGGWGYPGYDKYEYTISCVYWKGGNWKNQYPFAKGAMCSKVADPNATHVVDGLCSTQTQAAAFPECSAGSAELTPSLPLLAVMVLYCCLCLASVTGQ